MAKATTKATALTTLRVGTIEVAVGLFSTVATPGKLAQFDTAGPNGGVLKAREIARPVPVVEQKEEMPDQPVFSDPLAGDPGSELPPADLPPADLPPWANAALEEAATWPRPTEVDGQYGRELVEEGTGEVVLPQNVRRGVRLEDGRFIDCTAQLADIDTRTKLDSMEVVGFVDITRVQRARVKGALYIGAADEKAPKALRLLYEGLKSRRRGAVVKLTKRSRQTLGVVGWLDGVLVLYELVFAEDFREPPARARALQKATVTESEVAMVCGLIDAMAVPLDALDGLRDDALALREDLKGRALAGEVPEVLTPAAEPEQDELLAQLEASLAAVA